MPFQLPPLLLEIPRNPIFAIGLPLVLGASTGVLTQKREAWLAKLKKSPGAPPPQVFKYVWMMNYTLMGIASHLAVQAFDTAISPAMRDAAHFGVTLYWAQLGINLLWTPFYFGLQKPAYALVDAVAVASTAWSMAYWLHAPTGGKSTLVLFPYCSWLTFAFYLNAGVVWLNKDRTDVDGKKLI